MATILVVDDEAVCAEPMLRVLGSYGFDTLSARSGLEAFQRLNSARVDAIVLDLMMPEMDGLTFLSRLRRDPRWRHIPVIVVSGMADPEFVEGVRRFGCDGYIVKCRFSFQDLLEQLHVLAGVFCPATGADVIDGLQNARFDEATDFDPLPPPVIHDRPAFQSAWV